MHFLAQVSLALCILLYVCVCVCMCLSVFLSPGCFLIFLLLHRDFFLFYCCTILCVHSLSCSLLYAVATICGLDKIIGLFCKRTL